MKKVFYPLFLILYLTAFQSGAQTYVTIPDNNFVNWLTNTYPDCMDGNQMDIDCPAILNATTVNVEGYNISNLSGIEHFVNLAVLSCGYNQLTALPELPTGLVHLTCLGNQLNSLPALPDGLLHLDCNSNPDLQSLSELPPELTYLNVGGTGINLHDFIPLPETITFLSIHIGNYTELPPLPPNLEILWCSNNPITQLTGLPESLTNLSCDGCELNALPEMLPPGLLHLGCSDNNLTNLPDLPETLIGLECQHNQIESLPDLPDAISSLRLNNNALVSLPALPSALVYFWCHHNDLIALPDLPPSLSYLHCDNNQLTSLPELSSSLTDLRCQNNQLTSLPEIPQSLLVLNCSNNQITCFPPFPSSLGSSLYIDGNPFTCLPNYYPAMGVFGLLDYPLCEDGDLVNNPYGCPSAQGVAGKIYADSDADCALNDDEPGLYNIPVNLFDAQGSAVATTMSASNGVYFFSGDSVPHTVFVNTENKPYQVSCEDPGNEQEIDFSPSNQLFQNVHFGMECKPGFDVGVQSVVPYGWVFPGQEHTLLIAAGDFSGWYGLLCAEGVSGEVLVTVDGPVSFSGTPFNALTPDVVDNNAFTYFVDDFSAVNFSNSFKLLFVTDTTAQADDLVCVNVTVTPLVGDNIPENNTFTSCYSVGNSYDPNIKTVWPEAVEPSFDGYFNYTVYFQNTGNAPAFNIRIADTLDTQLDLSTFEVVNYSHEMLTYLHGNVATFRFNNIMLPDSTTDFEGSIGFVQYRIKPLADLPVGTIIENTAHIFFDFNEAIVTNTTENEYMIFTSVQDLAEGPVMLVFPNPGTGLFTLEIEMAPSQLVHIEVYNLRGERLQQFSTMNNRTTLDLTAYPSGMYLVRIQNEEGARHLKVVKQ